MWKALLLAPALLAAASIHSAEDPTGAADARLSPAWAEFGMPEARYRLAVAGLCGGTRLIDKARARGYLEAAAAQGYPPAQDHLFWLLNRPRATAAERARSLPLALAAAHRGDAVAMAYVAEDLDRPGAPAAQRRAALTWYLLAASQGVERIPEVRQLRAGLGTVDQHRAEEAVYAFKGRLPERLGRPAAWIAARQPRTARAWEPRALPADAAQAYLTQQAGAPWWPAGRPRPRCPRHAVPEAFIAQVRLADVPGLAADPGLLGLHICPRCVYVGPGGDPGVDVALFAREAGRPDGLGRVGDPGAQANRPRLRDVPDHMTYEESSRDEAPFDVEAFGRPAAWRPAEHPGVVWGAKLGGWPSWQQSPEWPTCAEGRRMAFVAQLDEVEGSEVGWGGGGSAYLFVCPPACRDRRGAVTTQY